MKEFKLQNLIPITKRIFLISQFPNINNLKLKFPNVLNFSVVYQQPKVLLILGLCGRKLTFDELF